MISVIVTLHNREKSIISALQSIVAQTAQQWECVIVDNASTDASEFQVNAYLIDRRMHYIRLKEQVSLQEARKIGLDATTGEWVMFMDGADYLDSNALQALYLIVKKYGTLAGIGHFAIERNGEPKHCCYLPEGKLTARQIIKGKHKVVTGNSIFARSIAYSPESWSTINYALTDHLVAINGEIEQPLVKQNLPFWKKIIRLFK